MSEIPIDAEYYDSRPETWEHIHTVQRHLLDFVNRLIQRSQEHDQSKLVEPELELFDIATPKLKHLGYGSEEYQQALAELKPALDHHYAKNSHHPEFYETKEQWRDIKGYEGIYQVSSLGRVRSLNRTVKRDGQGNFKKSGQKLRFNKNPKGYFKVQLRKEGKYQNFLVHRLVAIHFIDNPNEKPFVNHLNGIKTDNVVENLEWCTASENLVHAYDNGLKKPEVKYIVKCVEYNLYTEGCLPMEKELRKRGHEKASAASIWACINQERRKSHLDLTFEGFPIEEYDYSLMSCMTLMDLVEMFCDWKAATERMHDGNTRQSLEVNKKRFHISDQLHKIFENTVKELGW